MTLLMEEQPVDRLSLWRYERMLELGLDSETALDLLDDFPPDFLHRLEDLVRAGCPPELAKRILT